MKERRAPDASSDHLTSAMPPAEQRETDALVALLQQLPDPETPPDLAERVMESLAAKNAPRHWIDRAAPWVGSALAAGIAAIAVLTSLPHLPALRSPDASEQEGLRPSFAHPVATATTAGAREEVRRRPTPSGLSPVVVANRAGVALAHLSPTNDHFESFIIGNRDAGALLNRRLDHELNHLLLDPPSFFQRIASRRDRDQWVSRLAGRAASRGDAFEIGLQLRQRAPSPEGRRLAEALLTAGTLEQNRRR